mgnify:CR=1 FL=1
MKNIFVLPSKYVSKLYFYRGNFALSKKGTYGTPEITPHNIYITNSEKPKNGDYIVDVEDGSIGKVINDKDEHNFEIQYSNGKGLSCVAKDCQEQVKYPIAKIVICSDPELIKNGVQEVPEYFLKWFIVGKNPIEYVEIKPHLESLDTMKNSYEIIIPQPKQETIEEVANVTREVAYQYQTLFNFFSQEHDLILTITEMNEIISEVNKHQSEKTFSEEDMRNSFCNGYRANVKSSLNDSFQDWLNKFKK